MLEKIHEEGMIPGERGIMNKKGIYFHSLQYSQKNISSVYTGVLNISACRPIRYAEAVCTPIFSSAYYRENCVLHTENRLLWPQREILSF